MLFSFATRHCTMKVNPLVIDEFVTALDLVDEDDAFDKIQTYSPKVLSAISQMKTKPFGFTEEFKTGMMEQFKKLKDGEEFAIVDDWLLPNTPQSVFWTEYLEQRQRGLTVESAKKIGVEKMEALKARLAQEQQDESSKTAG